MYELIKDGDLAGVQRAVEIDPANLDARVTDAQDTPLTFALDHASRPQPAIAQWLIERGANLDLQNNNGWTALMFACRYRLSETAMALIQRNAKLDLQENDGWTALMFACRYDRPETAMALIQHNAKLDLQNNNGFTTLMLACRYYDTETAMALIQHNANLDLQSNSGETALMLACRYVQTETAMALIQRKVKVDLQDNEGWTALMFACRDVQTETAMALIQRNAKVDLQNNDGWTALMMACREAQPETAMALIQNNAKVDLQINRGKSALMLACQPPARPHHTVESLLRCVKICYANGADLNLKDSYGEDALAVAKRYKRRDAVAFLEFATASEVAQVLLGELGQPRSIVVAFFDRNLLTLESCSVLQNESLEEMGVTSSIKRRAILQRLNPSSVQPSRQSLPRRASQRVVHVIRRLSGA